MPARYRRSLTTDASANVFATVGANEGGSDELTAAALDEIRQLKHPPMPVRRTLEVVHLVLHSHKYGRGVPRDGVKWESVLRTLASDDLADRLQNFDLGQLQRYPNLAMDLQQLYFSDGPPRSPSKRSSLSRSAVNESLDDEALSPERVRRASTAAVTLFTWAAKAVDQAVPQTIETPEPRDESPESLLSEEVLPDVNLDEELQEGETPRLSVGVWATCPQGHGLVVGIAGSPTCAVCGTTILRGADSASCRKCGYFVCVNCRSGGWLTLISVSSKPVNFDIVGLRWLREEEELPEPLSLEAASADGVCACWGPAGPTLDTEVRIRLHNMMSDASFSTTPPQILECTVSDLPVKRTGRQLQRSSTRSSVFGLTDMRAKSAAVLIGLCGCPRTG